MNITNEATTAAAEGVLEAAFGQELPEAPIVLARAALEAALPHIRKQIAKDILSIYPEGRRVDPYTEGKQDGIDLSASIAEEGLF